MDNITTPENFYFHMKEAEPFLHIQLPIQLVKEKPFSSVSDSAKILYGLLLNRVSLSRKNGWIDENGRIYIIYSIKEIMIDMGISKRTAIRYLSQLTNIDKVIDNKNTGTFQLKKLEAKIGVNGTWQDITKDGYIEVAENCTVYAQATDSYGTVYSQMRYLDGYDTTPPTFNAAVNNGVLTVEAHDTESGVDCIYINGYKFKPNKKGKLTVRLQKFDSTYANFSIYVTDESGNESEPFLIENPYYKPKTDEDDDSPNPSDSLPSDATANETGESSAQITSVTDENGDDISEDVDGKQFYSVVTKNGQQFYIVIDMTGGEYFEGSTDTPASGGGTVYFLTNISNNDLLNVTADGEVTLPYNSQAAGNAIDDETVSNNGQETSEETTEEGEKKDKEESDSSNGTFVYIVFGIVAFVVIIVVVRRKKSGKTKTDITDEDDYDEDDYGEDDGIELTADNFEQFTDDSEEQEHE